MTERTRPDRCPNCGKENHNPDPQAFWCSERCYIELFARPAGWPGSVEADRLKMERERRVSH